MLRGDFTGKESDNNYGGGGGINETLITANTLAKTADALKGLT